MGYGHKKMKEQLKTIIKKANLNFNNVHIEQVINDLSDYANEYSDYTNIITMRIDALGDSSIFITSTRLETDEEFKERIREQEENAKKMMQEAHEAHIKTLPEQITAINANIKALEEQLSIYNDALYGLQKELEENS